ncbi:uncharacterized protein IUM83_01234 [Phytophthora cinnamomi]|uniref:uncharacterized protein n=1 Tax=Phytophthora cinnamomi TaxID=4785 RepID=UPI00355A824D|nr:hypothetical protein IUM83_01234 [Phytophthora cinnamomi]
MSASPPVSVAAAKAPPTTVQPEWEPDFIIINEGSDGEWGQEQEADRADGKAENVDGDAGDVDDLEAQMEALAIDEDDPAIGGTHHSQHRGQDDPIGSNAADQTAYEGRVASALLPLLVAVETIVEDLQAVTKHGFGSVLESLSEVVDAVDNSAQGFQGETRGLRTTVDRLTEKIGSLTEQLAGMKDQVDTTHQLIQPILDQAGAISGDSQQTVTPTPEDGGN